MNIPQSSRAGFQMIRSIAIQNFRCYHSLRVDNCARVNVIVGDNGSGKTALLEAMFMALAGNTEIAVRLRVQRGLDGNFLGGSRVIERAIFDDYFYKGDVSQPISVILEGDGEDHRSLVIFRGSAQAFLPLGDSRSEIESTSPFIFRWKNARGAEREAVPRIRAGKLDLPDTGEDLSDFFLIPATANISAVENASRFSDLSKSGKHKKLIELFTNEYKWLDAISVEVSGGSPALYASVRGADQKIPLANVSGGINRIFGIMLIIASRPKSVVLIDEIEAGIYYLHQKQLWKGLLDFAREFSTQLFVTTHSKECLEALIDASNSVEDVALWRIGIKDGDPVIRQFWGSTFKAGIESGGEVR
jgi:energy-coupling factor transporter ATP-binding protein EcfA2